jgi:hypothetical protein
MPEEKLSEKEVEQKIQEALEKINLREIPGNVMNMLRFLSSATDDKTFIESLQKEIVKKYGE